MAKTTIHITDDLLFRVDLQVKLEKQTDPTANRSRFVQRALEQTLGVAPAPRAGEVKGPVAARVTVAEALARARARP